ncbi:MAG: RES family NAD+ phosphorylase [Alphaproteobacteria bacterium]|nr:RES family NAD+ phosphorylase [Alphaproteobacteria bacterium]
MSFTTWTPIAVASEAAQARFDLWRAVEAQHAVSTMVLVDTLDEQSLLEQLLETSKPPLPPLAEGAHWLLFTPFRYPPPHHGSRFRGPLDPGVFYGAEDVRAACAELGFWRWRFLMESPSLAGIDPRPQTVFRAAVATLTVDLRRAPFDRDRARWVDPASYEATQDLARTAREGGIGAILYQSVSDPGQGGCGAVLALDAFAQGTPLETQTWWLSVTRDRVVWRRDDVFHRSTFEFDARAFQG